MLFLLGLGQKMVKKSQNQDILHFVFHCVRMMSGYFRNFNPPSPRSNPFSYPVNIVTLVVCWGVSDYCSVINPINLSYFLLLLLLYFLQAIINILLCYFIPRLVQMEEKENKPGRQTYYYLYIYSLSRNIFCSDCGIHNCWRK